MKKRYKLKRKKRFSKKVFYLIFIFLLSFYFSYKIFNIDITKVNFIKILLSSVNPSIESNYDSNIFNKIIGYINDIDLDSPISLVNSNYEFKNGSNNASDSVSSLSKVEINPIKIDDVIDDAIVYIYNTHQTEEYDYIANDNYNIKPNVTVNNYILKEQLEQYGIKSLVEEKSIMNVLNNNNWNYAASYKVSRMFMEEASKNYPSLKYFIDIHRDSVSKKISTTTIDNKSYAKILFIVGLDNPNYNETLTFTNLINERLNLLYPGLSRGIYKKSGPLVNGVYNQDFNNRTILIEVGGEENNIDEVNNTMNAIAIVLSQIIGEDYEEK